MTLFSKFKKLQEQIQKWLQNNLVHKEEVSECKKSWNRFIHILGKQIPPAPPHNFQTSGLQYPNILF